MIKTIVNKSFDNMRIIKKRIMQVIFKIFTNTKSSRFFVFFQMFVMILDWDTTITIDPIDHTNKKIIKKSRKYLRKNLFFGQSCDIERKDRCWMFVKE